jgi:ABC-type glutathione transport system ATPase component
VNSDSNGNQILLRAVDLTKIYSGRAEEIIVFRDLNLEVARGESVAVVGASGAGKSTVSSSVTRVFCG